MKPPTQEEEIDRNMKNLSTLAKIGWTAWVIVVALLFATTFCGCAGIPPGNAGFNSCDAVAAGTWYGEPIPAHPVQSALTQKDVERGVLDVLDGATFTTDPRLRDQTENCRKLIGYRVYTMPHENFIYPFDGKTRVSGFTVCQWKVIVVGTPPDRNFRKSALVHEFFHAIQECEGIKPPDPGVPSGGHQNWHRDGIFKAIDIEWNKP